MKHESRKPYACVLLTLIGGLATNFDDARAAEKPGGKSPTPRFGPVSEIRKARPGDVPWRVGELNFENAGQGLVRSYSCLFTIANYRPYGFFSSHTACELPGNLLRVRALGTEGNRHHFMAPAFWGAVNRYRMVDGRLYVSWRVKPPRQSIPGSRYSYVRPSVGPWEVWCNVGDGGRVVWTVETVHQGKRVHKEYRSPNINPNWTIAQLVLDPCAVTLQLDYTDVVRADHDAYPESFYFQVGSAQTKPGGAEVVTDYRELFISPSPYPDPKGPFIDGPEDLRPEDRAVVGYIHKATPREPRASEGDMIELKDGSLLAVYSLFYDGKGWDHSPARLVGRISKDGGRHWGEPAPIADRGAGSEGNVMSVSLLRAGNGDILMAYFDRTPEMKAKGMVLRRSADEGKTWGPRMCISPDNNPTVVIANNACLTRLNSGRIVLVAREYVWGVRMPLAYYSDDDGRTWKAGRHVPDGDLTAEEKDLQNLNEPSLCELADGRLLMTMRTIAGGQYFAWSSDQGRTWGTPVLSPLRGTCSPAILRRIPNSNNILAIWTYGFAGRTPLVSAISSDGGRTWKHLKMLEQSPYHDYCYVSCLFTGDRVLLSYMHSPNFSTLFRFEAEPGYIDQRFVNLPLAWFYR